jgi:glycosyltransferase involved in cell wall biosynthesis
VLALHGFGAPLWGEVLEQCGGRLPTLLVGHGTARPLAQRLLQARHPLTLPATLIEHLRTRRRYATLMAMTGPNSTALAAARSVYSGPVYPLTMGCDFDFWTPPAADTRAALRHSLGIPARRTVLVSTAFLRPIKQIDRLIEACAALGPRDDFTLLVIGQGDAAYVQSLRRLGAPLLADGRLRIEPYVAGEALRPWLWAADVFVSASRAEGASVAVMEAFACGLPVLSTPVGGTFEVMRRAGAGAVLPGADFPRWPGVLRTILDGRRPLPLERELARAEFDWRNVARRFVGLLDEVVARAARGRLSR